MIQIFLFLNLLTLYQQPEWLNCECAYTKQSIALPTERKKEPKIDPHAEACAWKVAERDLAKSFPQWNHEIFKTPYGSTQLKRHTWKAKKDGKRQEIYGDVEIKRKIPIMVAITGDFANDFDSWQHEIKHFIIHKLPIGGLTKWILHMHVDMVNPEWMTPCEKR